MNALLDTPFTQAMKDIWSGLKPKIIIISSAHWTTPGEVLWIGIHPHPPMIYDMYGFPDELYGVNYPVPGDENGWRALAKNLEKYGIKNVLDENRWIDHGIWSALIHLFPEANIPIIPISVPYSIPSEFHYQLGQALGEIFPSNDILYISSGNIVHNLSLIDWKSSETPIWAHDFDEWIEQICKSGNYREILKYQNIHGAPIAVPTREHFQPFITFLGSSEGKRVQSVYRGFELGSISTRIYKNF